MLVTLFRLLARLPLPVLHAIGATLGWLVYLLAPSYRRRLKGNIKAAGFGEHLSSAISEAGKNVMELPFVWCADPQRVASSVRIENWEVVEAALQAGRGVVFLTPHLGCFEITAQVVGTQKPLTVLYRPPHKAVLKPLIEGARARGKLKLAPANLSGVRMLLKALRQGQLIGLLPDQVPQNGEGIWAPFFRRPAYTMTLPGKLQQMTGATVIITFAERLPHGKGYAMRMVELPGALGESPLAQATAANAAMEHMIAQCPAQYFWSYNRYKVPDGVAPPNEQETD
ncbi:lysophospholipid acyltransferase family protein [Herbaspirillum sp. GCM10030257]|uniref:lysophospholipid acyltransferase family protein n=1 Tax=Herbaspirillum sp. GCM10030257 TaxID=3273393 RepID=UPI0036241E03